MAILNIITFDETEQRIETALPDPQTMQWDSADVEAEGCSGTNQLGEYFREVLDDKITLSVSWGSLSDTEISRLLSLVAGENFMLEYPDAKLGQRVTGKFYINSRTSPMYCYTYGSADEEDGWKWQGLSLTFTEV